MHVKIQCRSIFFQFLREAVHPCRDRTRVFRNCPETYLEVKIRVLGSEVHAFNNIFMPAHACMHA